MLGSSGRAIRSQNITRAIRHNVSALKDVEVIEAMRQTALRRGIQGGARVKNEEEADDACAHAYR